MCRNTSFLLVVASVCLATGVALAGTKAKNPNPADGTVGAATPLLQWTKGDGALFHNVYVGTTPELTAANLVANRQPFEMYYHVAGFQPGVTYFWRVDEIETDGVTVVTGDVWRFTTQALTAYYPSPSDGAEDSVLAPVLTWMPGAGAAKHHLYFGDSLDAVTQGAAAVDKGLLEMATTTFAPGELAAVTTYYWRVDEVLTDQTVRAGPVWKFTTFLSVDDFEAYNDDEGKGTRIYETWIDGWTNNNGATVGNTDPPFAERTTIHDGNQAMPLDYNNVVTPYYSETVRTWSTPQDWTAGSVDTLTLYFRGRSTNSPGRLYVALKDSKGKAGAAVYPNSNHVALAAWTRWEIPLSEFSAAGVNLTLVKTMSIGVGNPDNPAPGGTGRLVIDDIYLGGPGGALGTTILFAEDFEGLPLGKNVDEALAGEKVWTKTAPPGWVHDDTKVPGIGTATDGVTEWAGWSFADRLWWTETAEDQDRSQFTKGVGAVAIADDDEWDDQDHGGWAAGYYTTFLSTPAIDISTAKPGTLKLTFDSAWKPECLDDGPGTNNQTAQVTVSYDGAKAVEVLRWQSDTGSPYYHANATNETVVLSLDAPAGAKTMVLTFGLLNAGNDWWWAIDNVVVTSAP